MNAQVMLRSWWQSGTVGCHQAVMDGRMELQQKKDVNLCHITGA